MTDEPERDPRDIVTTATAEIVGTLIDLWGKWQRADREVARLTEELEGVRARARAHIEANSTTDAVAFHVIGEVLWGNAALIERYKEQAGPKPRGHEWSTEYHRPTCRAVGGRWFPVPVYPAPRPLPLKWHITHPDGHEVESFTDAASAWQRWDSDMYDRSEYELFGPEDTLLAKHGYDSRRLAAKGFPGNIEPLPMPAVARMLDRMGVPHTIPRGDT